MQYGIVYIDTWTFQSGNVFINHNQVSFKLKFQNNVQTTWHKIPKSKAG